MLCGTIYLQLQKVQTIVAESKSVKEVRDGSKAGLKVLMRKLLVVMEMSRLWSCFNKGIYICQNCSDCTLETCEVY